MFSVWLSVESGWSIGCCWLDLVARDVEIQLADSKHFEKTRYRVEECEGGRAQVICE